MYNHSAPIVGKCTTEDLPHPQVFVEEKGDYIVVHTPEAALSDALKGKEQFNCGDSSTSLQYITYFLYLEPENFQHDIYFEGIKKLLFGEIGRHVHQAKQVYSPHERFFEKLPGTGIIFNSVVIDKQRQQAFYVPSVTYSCPLHTWNSHCTDVNISKRALSVLLVLYSVVMIVNLMMPELVESTLNGMLIGSFFFLSIVTHRQTSMSGVDIFMISIFGGIVSSLFCGILSLHLKIGRYLTKLTFSNLMMAIVMETCFDNITSIYLQFGGAFIFSLCLHFIRISFSVLVGGLLLIMSLSHLLRVGNIHRILVNNFHILTARFPSTTPEEESIWSPLRNNFINYKINLNLLDTFLIMLYVIFATILTLRKEIYFLENPDIYDAHHAFNASSNTDQFNRGVAKNRCKNCMVGFKSNGRLKLVSRCRRHHYRSNVIHERSPLISHWIETDESEDEVFESPNTNSRFLRTLSSESRERLEAIQNFKEISN